MAGQKHILVVDDDGDVQGVIVDMLGEGAIAVRAEAAAILLSTVCVHAQAGVLVWVEWAEIEPVPSG